MEVVNKGDEAAAKQFLTDHINEFSEEEQKSIVSAFFFDALEKKASAVKQKAAVEQEALAMLKDIKSVEQVLGDEKKKADLRDELAAK